jgi:hypothetical protein
MKRTWLPWLALALPAAAPGAMEVWVAGSLERVRPHDAPGAARVARIAAARNEYAPFQVAIRAGQGGLNGVDARAQIDGATVTLYREHYVEVTKPSPLSVEGKGWYPDALIPFPTAAPFSVEEAANRVLWVDVYVPADTVPGVYRGSLTITAEGEPAVATPVELTVWNFTLPDTPSMRSWFGNASRVTAWYGARSGSPEERLWNERLAAALAAARISPLPPSYLYPKVLASGDIDASATDAALREFMERYRVTGLTLSLLGADPLGSDRARNERYLRAMYAYLQRNGWEKLAYVYVLDEPNTAEAYDTVRARAKFIHETQPGIKVLCTEQPTPQDPAWGTLVGSVDIWVPLWPLLEKDDGDARLAAGDEMWSYTALCQNAKKRITPFWQLDFPLLNYRLPAWMNWRSGMTGLLYWTTTYWQPGIDYWNNPLSYKDSYNLEGVLFYPGEAAGYDGLVPSMRLMQIREGMQDYEYLRLLAARGLRDDADRLALSVARSWTDWNADPEALPIAKRQAAQLIGATPAPRI